MRWLNNLLKYVKSKFINLRKKSICETVVFFLGVLYTPPNSMMTIKIKNFIGLI